MSDLTPHVCVSDARAAADWYADVLGAARRSDPIVMPDNRIGHDELWIGDSLLMLAEPFPTYGVEPPDSARGNAVSLHLTVDDVDAATERARAAGATIDREPEDTEHGWLATFHDPFGHRWMLNAVPV